MATFVNKPAFVPPSQLADSPQIFTREDWTLFREVPTLCQKAGVSQEFLIRLLLKELTDNALDTGATVRCGTLDGGGFFVEDDGPGIAGTPEAVADFFSIRRPLRSSKLFRVPSRGALGNGLRVVAGAVLATDGDLRIRTNGRWLQLGPQDAGHTAVQVLREDSAAGTRVEIRLGPNAPPDDNPLAWAERAVLLASGGTAYLGRSSPHWYDSGAFFEICQAAGNLSARDLVGKLEGCTGRRAGEIAQAFRQRPASSLDRDEADNLLESARDAARLVVPRRLGCIGERPDLGARAVVETTFTIQPARGRFAAELPAIVEAWAFPARKSRVELHVNRTPVAASVSTQRDTDERASIVVFGCGLAHSFRTGKAPLGAWINVTTPHVSLTSDGKEPDLEPLVGAITTALEKAARKGRRSAVAGARPCSQKEAVLEALPGAIAQAGGDGQHRFSQRQLYYVVRPRVREATGADLTYDHFEKVLTQHEQDRGPIAGLTRDPRGIIYHPHLREEIPLGTLAVEQYERPAWTFRDVLYCEKEGFFQILRDARWPERHDCALLTSKGFATRAVRDLVDHLATNDDEPVRVFCIHDADGPGTLIHQALQEGTAARPQRRLVEVVNLGLEPEEALAMGLEVETVERKGAVPVADYVTERWKKWLQGHRVELNAMDTPTFLAWLDRKMAPYEVGKLVPPSDVLEATFREVLAGEVRERTVAGILRDARADEQVRAKIEGLEPAVARELPRLNARVTTALRKAREEHWRTPVVSFARELVDGPSEAPPSSRRGRKRPGGRS